MATSVLLTRPETQSRRFAQALVTRFGAQVAPVIAPLQRIVPRPPLPPVPTGSQIVFTSENGVAAFVALGGHAAGRLAWCVGRRTAEATGAAGFAVRTGPGDAAGLIAAILAAGGDAPLVHLHGAHLSADVAAALRAAGRSAVGHVVYDQVACTMAAAGVERLAGTAPVVVPVFSARSGALVAPYLAAASAPVAIAAISPAVAAALRVQGVAATQVAARADAAAMVDAVGTILEAGSFLERRIGGR